ncbi:ERG4/ERG24 ergosterol biosynthesis protein [Lactarius deliciosus]|nr:ERG4/ERG24 ergosterol biosynthesis protein [Lactarius deliciosus]
MSGTTTATDPSQLRQRTPGSSTEVTVTDEGRKTDKLLDSHTRWEFGGPWGVTAMMWICLWFYDGRLVFPTSIGGIKPFLNQMWAHVRDVIPNLYAWKVYSGLIFYELFLAWVMPGYMQEGLPVPSLGYKTLMYKCNALFSVYFTLATAAIIDNYGHIMSVAMIWGFAVSFGTYFWAVARGEQMRMSGNFIYDVFMGAALNPRIGPVDLKMWAEVRIPWVIVFFLAVSGACKQYEQYGAVTPVCSVPHHSGWLVLINCEECIPQTWDMFHEKWGFMVIFWNFAGVPFTYVYSVVYMASHEPEKYQFSTRSWDTSMSQKSRFKMQTQGIYSYRWTFPQLPWGTVKNPTYIQTAHGNRLLTNGWWQFSRKPNYVADWTMSFTWGLVVGTASPIPYFYSVFFITVLIHRTTRDFERCALKYGKDWERYCEIVRWKFIPGIY